MKNKKTRLAFEAFWILFCSVCLLMSCGKKPLRVDPSRLNSELPVPTVTPTPTPTGTPVAGCTDLAGQLTLVYPASTAAIVPYMGVVWRIDASGCNNRYKISGETDTFSGSVNLVRTYPAGSYSENFLILGLAESGNDVVRSVVVQTPTFTVSSVPNPTPTPTTAIPDAACTITKESMLTADDNRINFQIHPLNSATLSANVNGAAAAFNTNIAIRPNAAGIYEVNGVVDGPGNPGVCRLVFDPPRCQVSVASSNYSSANILMKLFGPMDHATLDGTAITMPILPENSVNVAKSFGDLASKTSTGRVYNAAGDTNKCTVTYNRPAPQVVKVIWSFWSDASSSLLVTPTSLTLKTNDWWPMGDVQMLAIREDGTKVIEFEAVAPFPWVKDSYATRTYGGNYAPFLLGEDKVINFHNADLDFAMVAEMQNGSPITRTSNRGQIIVSHTSGSRLSVRVNDTDWYAGYYQVSLCRRGFNINCDL